jgi:hypothetical protein
VLRVGAGALGDEGGRFARHLGVTAGGVALVRPDLYLAARIDRPDPAAVVAALSRALCIGAPALFP